MKRSRTLVALLVAVVVLPACAASVRETPPCRLSVTLLPSEQERTIPAASVEGVTASIEYVPFQALGPIRNRRVPADVRARLRQTFTELARDYRQKHEFPTDRPFASSQITTHCGSRNRFSYAVHSDNAHDRWEAVAIGDPHCEGAPVVFRLSGSVDANHELYRDPNFETSHPLSTPTALLRELRRAVDAEDERRFRTLFWAVTTEEGLTNADHAVSRLFDGQFGFGYHYNPATLDATIAQGDAAFRPLAHPESLRSYSSQRHPELFFGRSPQLRRIEEREPDAFHMMNDGRGTFILLIRRNGVFRFIYWTSSGR